MRTEVEKLKREISHSKKLIKKLYNNIADLQRLCVQHQENFDEVRESHSRVVKALESERNALHERLKGHEKEIRNQFAEIKHLVSALYLETHDGEFKS